MPPAEYSVLSRLPIPGTSRLPGFLPGHDSAELTGSVLWTDDRQKAALAYAEAITWHFDTGDAFWERLRSHFSEPELVELGLRGSPGCGRGDLSPCPARSGAAYAGGTSTDPAGGRDAAHIN